MPRVVAAEHLDEVAEGLEIKRNYIDVVFRRSGEKKY